jgi:GT2 family glycosyltransferase
MHPELSVIVASHARPLRLRWLLNALAEQTLERGLWEVVVCYDSPGAETHELLEGHALAREGVLRSVYDPRTSTGLKRNVAVELARASTLVFTDDDCRPPADWLENVYGAVRRNPGAIIQGPIEGDPDEWAMRRAPRPLTQAFSDVPTPWGECCNIVYPREVVLRVGGFWAQRCEDTDLNLRARATGVEYLGDAAMLTYHAIVDASIATWARSTRRRSSVPRLIKRHPELRQELTLRVFYKREHLWLLVALAALRGVRGQPWRALLVLPWAADRGSHGDGLRGRVRDLFELPGWAVIDAAELLAVVRGSIRHRTLVL